jgi:8-oxo-dGTP pyrophosphatase MutT (NUDIX family)
MEYMINKISENDNKKNQELKSNQNNNIKEINGKINHKKEKIFKSASLTFYDKNLGYLLCDEFRYKEKKTLVHTVGGKVEPFDKNIFETAIREFIEETSLEAHNFFNEKNLVKEELIKEIVGMFKKKEIYKDLCINKESKYYHRYYLIILNEQSMSPEIINSIYELPEFFNGRFKTEIESLRWVKKENLETNKNKLSWLTKMFIKKLDKYFL